MEILNSILIDINMLKGTRNKIQTITEDMLRRFLVKLMIKFKANIFFGNNIQKIDICILPFIRQFRIADIKWFDNLDEISNVKKYLNNFLNSELLANIMHKYKKWEEGDFSLQNLSL